MPKVKHEFKLSYDFTSTKEHTIPAEILGNSLINMAALIKESDKVLNGESSTTDVQIKAHKEGSFQIEVVAWLEAGGIDVLKTLGITSAVVATGAANLFAAIKALKNRTISAKAKLPNGQWEITFDDDEKYSVDNNAIVLLENHSIRSRLSEVIKKPSDGEDKATVSFIDIDDISGAEKESVVITKDETEYFKTPPRKLFAVEHTVEEEKNIIFTVISLEKKTGWRIRLPDNSDVAVKIEDESFLGRINKRESGFIKGDMFVVLLRTVEKEIDGNVTVSRSILRVIRHRVETGKKVIVDEPRG